MHLQSVTCVKYHNFTTLAMQETSFAYSLTLGSVYLTKAWKSQNSMMHQAAIFGLSCGDHQISGSFTGISDARRTFAKRDLNSGLQSKSHHPSCNTVVAHIYQGFILEKRF